MSDYRSIPRISQSGLKRFGKDRRKFADEEVYKTRHPDPPTADQIKGCRFEAYLFDGEIPGVVELPAEALTKNGGKKATWKEYTEGYPADADFFTPKEYENLLAEFSAMKGNVYRHPQALPLVRDSEKKVIFTWTDEETGVEMKAEIDMLIRGVAIGDLKTDDDADPDNFTRDIVKWGYDLQAAVYQEAVERATGERLPFIALVCKKSPSYICETFEITAAFIDLGRRKYRKLIREYADCKARDNWDSPTFGRVVPLYPTAWHERQLEAWG
jgi:hypothetical protein